MFMQTPALCRPFHPGAQRRSYFLPPQTPPAWSCSALDHGLMWSARWPCFSSASSQRADEEEEEEGHLLWHHHESMRHSDLHLEEIKAYLHYVL